MENGADIIDKFGGAVKLAEALEVEASAVRMWRHRRKFPARYWMRLFEISTNRNLGVSVEDIETFGGKADG